VCVCVCVYLRFVCMYASVWVSVSIYRSIHQQVAQTPALTVPTMGLMLCKAMLREVVPVQCDVVMVMLVLPWRCAILSTCYV
jgi:tellurite resistance protein TehA-like permease